MYLRALYISGFKSFANQYSIVFDTPIAAIVGPNGSGKSNIAEAFRFVLGEQSIKSLRGKKGSDLIFSGQQGGPRVNRASVKVVFDNKKRLMDINFDEVVIERVVHRDGINEYFVNGSSVRLKDITELLAGAHIGSSGHHIISQGEADRLLNASQKERRAILEDALGLRVYQYKIAESERKLKKTEQNIQEVELLRREIGPHLKFLKKQVEKVEEGKQLQQDLINDYHTYLAREEAYLRARRKELDDKKQVPEEQVILIKDSISQLEIQVKSEEQGDAYSEELKKIDIELSSKRDAQQEVYRSLGMLEGEMHSLKRMLERLASEKHERKDVLIKMSVIKEKVGGWISLLKEAISGGDVRATVERINNEWQEFSNADEDHHVDSNGEQRVEIENNLSELEDKKSDLDTKLQEIVNDLNRLGEARQVEEKIINEKRFSLIEAERALREEETKLHTQERVLEEIHHQFLTLQRDEESFREELREASALIGHIATHYKSDVLSNEEVLSEERNVQSNRRRELEKKKIKFEELGISGSSDIMKEYEELAERDSFLLSEIEDLQKAASDVRSLINDLQSALQKEFSEGITKINNAFSEYFTLMFGGGESSLTLTEETVENEDGVTETREGIDIAVSLPRKKIRDLMMLSGGERALTSIALLFAMSSVNPPPFIILDETDAALDEANSKKYGDMIENLARQSQLILITHNRETMSRAGVLYGVTMTAQGASSVLSIKFDEAVKVAK